MKKIVLSVALYVTLATASGIPVVDAAANAQALQHNIQTVAEWAKEAQRWSDTVSHYREQIDAYQQQIMAATQIRDSVQFVQDIQEFQRFANYYKEDLLTLDPQSILNASGAIGGRAKALFDKYNLFDDCNVNYFVEAEKNICQNKMMHRVKELVAYEQYNNTLEHIGANLNTLASKLVASQDIKESADINNAIQLQIAQLELAKRRAELISAQTITLEGIEQKQNEQLEQQRRTKKLSELNYN